MLQVGTNHIGQSQPAELFAIAGFLQLIINFVLFGRDTQKVVVCGHLDIDAEFHLVVELLHLPGICFQHLHLRTHGYERIVGIVNIADDLHANLPLLFLADGLADTCQTVCGCYLSSGIEWLCNTDASQIGAACLQRQS